MAMNEVTRKVMEEVLSKYLAIKAGIDVARKMSDDVATIRAIDGANTGSVALANLVARGEILARVPKRFTNSYVRTAIKTGMAPPLDRARFAALLLECIAHTALSGEDSDVADWKAAGATEAPSSAELAVVWNDGTESRGKVVVGEGRVPIAKIADEDFESDRKFTIVGGALVGP